MLVSSHLSPRLKHIVTGIFTVPANLLNSEAISLLPQVSTKLAQRSFSFLWHLVGVELRDASTVTMNNVLPTFLSLNLSALCTEVDVKYSAFFEGCSVGLIQEGLKEHCFWYVLLCRGRMLFYLPIMFYLQPKSSLYTTAWIFLFTQWAQLQNMSEFM